MIVPSSAEQWFSAIVEEEHSYGLVSCVVAPGFDFNDFELARRVERNCGRVEWSVLDWNEPSIQFYKKLGAVPMDEWTMFRVTGDALKKLAEM